MKSTTNYKSNFAAVLAQVEALDQKKSNTKDERYWKLTKDKSGNGVAEIRFLPELPEQVPVVKLFNHYFENNKKWFIGNCPTSINLPCPVCENNKDLWATGTKENQDTVKSRKRKLHYISNIVVIKDPLNPENEGKVFLFKYGQKIYEKLLAKIKPLYDFEEKVNPFDVEEGANFILKGTNVKLGDKETFSYDQSAFNPVVNLADVKGIDIDTIMSSRYSLLDEVSLDKFDSYDELETRLNRTLGNGSIVQKNVEGEKVNSKNQTAEEVTTIVNEKAKVVKEVKEDVSKKLPELEADDTDDAAYFERLAEMN